MATRSDAALITFHVDRKNDGSFWQPSFTFGSVALKATQSLSPTKSSFCLYFGLLSDFSGKTCKSQNHPTRLSVNRTTCHHRNYYYKLFNSTDRLNDLRTISI